MYVTEDPQTGWDGTYNNHLVQSDVFIWRVEFVDERTNVNVRNEGHVQLLK